jgi:hypothetical protein
MIEYVVLFSLLDIRDWLPSCLLACRLLLIEWCTCSTYRLALSVLSLSLLSSTRRMLFMYVDLVGMISWFARSCRV